MAQRQFNLVRVVFFSKFIGQLVLNHTPFLLCPTEENRCAGFFLYMLIYNASVMHVHVHTCIV